jgi:GTPase SAR1 family protein
MEIIEHENDIKIKNTSNNLDKIVSHKIPDVLPNQSGFCMNIIGSAGSGKTTLLYSLMTNKKQSYRKVFNTIYIVSPTIANDSIKNDPFSKLPEDQIYRHLSLDILDELEAKIKENRKDELNSVIILDDVGSQLRKSKLTQKLLNKTNSNDNE